MNHFWDFGLFNGRVKECCNISFFVKKWAYSSKIKGWQPFKIAQKRIFSVHDKKYSPGNEWFKNIFQRKSVYIKKSCIFALWKQERPNAAFV